MKKILIYILLILGLCSGVGMSSIVSSVHADVANNIQITGGGGNESNAAKNNDKLQDFNNGRFIDIAGDGGERGLYRTLVAIARDLKNLFYAIATIYFIVISLKLILSSNTEEELGNFKKGIIWITIGLIVMQIAYVFAQTLFDQGVSARLGIHLIENLIWPLIALLQTLAGIFFIAVAIYAFYRLVTANGNEDAIKSGKMTILYAIIGFMIIRFARAIVEAFYGRIGCDDYSLGIIEIEVSNCVNQVNVSEGVNIIINILNYFNGFVAIIVMIMVIYTGAQVLLSSGEEEKITKAKSSLIYIGLGMFLLAFNYLILTFFLVPEIAI